MRQHLVRRLFVVAAIIRHASPIFGTIILARLFSPAEFEPIARYIAVGALPLALTCLKFDDAVIASADEPERELRAGAALAASAVVAAMTVGLLAILRLVGVSFDLHAADIGALGFHILALGCWQVGSATLLRKHDLTGWGRSEVTASAASTMGQVALAAAASDPHIVLFGFGTGYAVAAVVAWQRAGSPLQLLATLDARRATTNSWRFPAFLVPQAILGALRTRTPIAVLSMLPGNGAALYYNAERLVMAPNHVATSVLRPGIQASFARSGTSGVAECLRRSLVIAGCIGFGGGVLAGLAPRLVPLVLGESWTAAVPYVQALAIPLTVLAATNWMDRVFHFFHQQAKSAALEACAASAVGATALVCLWTGAEALTVAWACAVVNTTYLAAWWWTAIRVGTGSPRLALTGMALLAGAFAVPASILHVLVGPQ